VAKGIDLAKTVRTRLGDRLIRHSEWGSFFPYSTSPSGWSPNPDKIATHHHGGSAQLPRQSGTRTGAIAQIKTVDDIHKSPPRNWAHGFAYGFAILKGGFIGEGRSFWYPWGAHPGDIDADGISENIEAIPVYWAVGTDDGNPANYPADMWEAAGILYPLLIELCGIDPKAMYGHQEINPTSCPGALMPLVRDWKINGFHTIGGSTPMPTPTWPATLRLGDNHPKVTVLRGLLLALGHVNKIGGGTFYNKAVKAGVVKFQKQAGVAADGIFGSATRAKMYDAIAVTKE